MTDMDVLARNWMGISCRGLISVAFGLLTYCVPHLTLVVLVVAFGTYACADGAITLLGAYRNRFSEIRRWPYALEGALSLTAGVLTLAWPTLTALALLYVIAGWSIGTGVTKLIAAARLQKLAAGEWRLALSGVASIGLGITLTLDPAAGSLAFVLWIGCYVVTIGALLVALGLHLKSWQDERDSSAALPQPLPQ